MCFVSSVIVVWVLVEQRRNVLDVCVVVLVYNVPVEI